jgi:hypothetical protein
MATRINSSFTNPLIVLAIGLATAMAVGCGDDDNSDNTPAGGTKATMGGGGNAGNGGTKAGSSTGGTKAGSSTGGTSEPTAGGGAGPVDMGGEAGMGGAAPENCTDDADKGCYSCKPKTLTQFLNACPTTGCEPFDNKTLTSFAGGKLPKLP